MIFGPPGSSSPETEIYRLLRFEGNLPGAFSLALLQTISALAVLGLFSVASARSSSSGMETGARRELRRLEAWAWCIMLAYAFFLLLCFIAPLFSILASSFTARRGIGSAVLPSLGPWLRQLSEGRLLAAVAATLITALPAAAIATLVGLCLGRLLRRRRHLVAVSATLPLAISAVIAASGWRLIFPDGGIAVVILIQTLTALPFSIGSSASSFDRLSGEPALAARSLGAGRLRSFFDIEIPSILPVTLSSAAFSFALSAGDATTPLVLGLPDFEPLPLAVYRLVGAYRYPEACVFGVVLALFAGSAFFFKEGRSRHARA